MLWVYFEKCQEASHDYTAFSHSPSLAFSFLENYFPPIFLCGTSSILYRKFPFCFRKWILLISRHKRHVYRWSTQQRDKRQQSWVAAREIPVGYKGKQSCHASVLRAGTGCPEMLCDLHLGDCEDVIEQIPEQSELVLKSDLLEERGWTRWPAEPLPPSAALCCSSPTSFFPQHHPSVQLVCQPTSQGKS